MSTVLRPTKKTPARKSSKNVCAKTQMKVPHNTRIVFCGISAFSRIIKSKSPIHNFEAGGDYSRTRINSNRYDFRRTQVMLSRNGHQNFPAALGLEKVGN